jgi:hypothetical protein
MFNITISNVPGPDTPLYFRGAELVAIYPASIVTHGQALNITCESYAGAMNFGFTGCHSSLPSMQRLAVYAEEALAELEAAVMPAPKPARKSPRKAAPVATPAGGDRKQSKKSGAPRKAQTRPARRKAPAA